MMRMRFFYLLTLTVVVGSCAPADEDVADAPMEPTMSFFLTSAGPGNGAELGGLAGADAYCQSLAAAAGAGGSVGTDATGEPRMPRDNPGSAETLRSTERCATAAVHGTQRTRRGWWNAAETLRLVERSVSAEVAKA